MTKEEKLDNIIKRLEEIEKKIILIDLKIKTLNFNNGIKIIGPVKSMPGHLSGPG